MSKFFRHLKLAAVILVLASISQPGSAGVMTFDFVSSGGVHELEIVVNLPVSALSDIQSLTVLPTNDVGLPSSDLTLRLLEAGGLSLDAAGTGLTSDASTPPFGDPSAPLQTVLSTVAPSFSQLFLAWYVDESLYPDNFTIGTQVAAIGDWELRPQPVPEPNSFMMLASAAVLACGFYRRKCH